MKCNMCMHVSMYTGCQHNLLTVCCISAPVRQNSLIRAAQSLYAHLLKIIDDATLMILIDLKRVK
jgi:hypothetical protein